MWVEDVRVEDMARVGCERVGDPCHIPDRKLRVGVVCARKSTDMNAERVEEQCDESARTGSDADRFNESSADVAHEGEVYVPRDGKPYNLR